MITARCYRCGGECDFDKAGRVWCETCGQEQPLTDAEAAEYKKAAAEARLIANGTEALPE